MSLEVRIINLKLAMKQEKPKSVVRYKFRKYKEEYDNQEKSVFDKVRYRDLSMEFYRYMMSKGEDL
jgi:hypothetical protein